MLTTNPARSISADSQWFQPRVAQPSLNLIPGSESSSSPPTRLYTPVLALLGLYPQYRAVRSIWLGWVASPDWTRYDEVSRRFIYIIEPVVESLLQLFCQIIILCIFIGPGEGAAGGKA